MVFDMNRPLIEREWILPRINDLGRQTRKVKFKDNIVDLANSIGLNLMVRPAKERTLYFLIDEVNHYSYFVHTLETLYKDVLGAKIFMDLTEEDLPIVMAQLEQGKISNLTVTSKDHEWLRHTSLAESVPRARDAVLDLAAMVKASVSQQEKLAGVLFE